MTPSSPVLPSNPALAEVVYGRTQAEYQNLPAIRCQDGTIISRWRLSWYERFLVLFTGDVWLMLLTDGHPQPSIVTAAEPRPTY